MKRARVIMGIVAVAAAGGAAFMAKSAIKPPQKMTIVKEISEDHVLVASRDVSLGEELTRSHLRWEPWPKKQSKNYITRKKHPQALRKYTGSIARSSLQRGEPINARKVVSKEGGGVLAAILPAGMRAISTPINGESAAGGFILPNDRVDVILSRSVKRGREKTVFSDTILRNVRVLAIGDLLENKKNKKNSGSGKSTATLELTPSQVRTLAAAQEQGDIALALRSLADLRRDGQRPSGGDAAALEKARKSEDSGAVIYLKYGVPSQAVGLQ